MLTDPLPALTLLHGVGMRLMAASDAGALADAYLRNRAYLAPWEPLREDSYFTAAGQEAVIATKLALYEAGTEVQGFERIGLAPQYLKIAGQWQDHELFQRILQGPL